MKIAVTRIGALFHYSIPRTVHSLGMLGQFYTDAWAGKTWGRALAAVPAAMRPDRLRRLLGRQTAEVPSALVTDFPVLAFRFGLKRRSNESLSVMIGSNLWVGEEFCRRIIRHGMPGCDAVYTTNSQGLELLRHARERGMKTMMEQTIAPYEYECRVLGRVHEKHPGWEVPPTEAGKAGKVFMERERAEWELSDVIFCGSNFVRDGIGAVGGPVEKCRVVPYGFSFSRLGVPKTVNRDGPLRVLFMGTVCLRKGMADFVRVAEALQGRMNFRVVGPEILLPEAGARLRRCAEVPGPVPRAEVGALYEWADVFLFPSHCEGSATVCYEALAHGVPVICTQNTGSVVRDGMEGFIVEAGDVEGMICRLEQLDSRRDELARLSAGALARRDYFSAESYAGRMREVLEWLDRKDSDLTRESPGGKDEP